MVGDIRALCPELLGLYIAVGGVTGGRSNNEAPLDHQTIKNRGGGSPYLGLVRTSRKRCRILSITVKRRVWWSIVIF